MKVKQKRQKVNNTDNISITCWAGVILIELAVEEDALTPGLFVAPVGSVVFVGRRRRRGGPGGASAAWNFVTFIG